MLTRFYICLMVLTVMATMTGCSNDSRAWQQMNDAERIMENHPDSALLILEDMSDWELKRGKESARYALLKSMAYDKNYIDKTTFDVLKPALDYYLKKGTPDERLKTYYYQGVIFLNQGDKDSALNSFMKSLDNINGSVDSLCMARAFVAQALLYKDFYDFENYTNGCLKAAHIYKSKGFKNQEFDCLLNALNGTIILNRKYRSDSIMNVINHFSRLNTNQKKVLAGYNISYILTYNGSSRIIGYCLTCVCFL